MKSVCQFRQADIDSTKFHNMCSIIFTNYRRPIQFFWNNFDKQIKIRYYELPPIPPPKTLRGPREPGEMAGGGKKTCNLIQLLIQWPLAQVSLKSYAIFIIPNQRN